MDLCESTTDSRKSQTISIRAAAREPGVSYSTARDRILGLKPGEIGAPLKYSGEEEELFCDFVLASAELGVPLRKQLLINTVIDYEKEKGMQSSAASLLSVPVRICLRF